MDTAIGRHQPSQEWDSVEIGGVHVRQHKETKVAFAHGKYYDWNERMGMHIGSEEDDESNLIFRLRVLSSDIKNLHAGSLAELNSTLSIGRDAVSPPIARSHLRLRELQVSRIHAKMYVASVLCPRRGLAVVVLLADLGSTHGSFIDNERISPPKETNRAEVLHAQVITIGSTTFEVHIHPEFACKGCSISNATTLLDMNPKNFAQVEQAKAPPKESIEVSRKREQNTLKRSLLGGSKSCLKVDGVPRYTDRSAIRRKLHNGGAATYTNSSDVQQFREDQSGFAVAAAAASTLGASSEPLNQQALVQQYLYNRHFHSDSGNSPANELDSLKSIEPGGSFLFDSVGQEMMKKMGWKQGAGMGRKEDGIVEPVQAYLRIDAKKGLGG
ncbi:hypothetical protein BJ741DRAFT_610844 [Chytriomyces cf. hyalinus JEL632]|nr:hypothetical protein BJ741DRAFT_610844 [Chytriomyces cf. hyalinus JEL632]